MDNMFVIATIFGFLAIPRIYQHRVLFWGILGVIAFRAILIGLGAALVHSVQLDPRAASAASWCSPASSMFRQAGGRGLTSSTTRS
jgi:predicted tellurium resistance membrane protein TerC